VWTGAFFLIAFVGIRASQRIDAPRIALAIPSVEASAFLASAPAQTTQPPPCSSQGRVKDGRLPDGRVVLNRAGPGDLTNLPGIGEKRAQAIVDLRERLGRFRSLRDLLRVRGLGLKLLRRIESLVVIDPPVTREPHPEPQG
jgi:competence ComEA-like helix-hairpin-helix protein